MFKRGLLSPVKVHREVLLKSSSKMPKSHCGRTEATYHIKFIEGLLGAAASLDTSAKNSALGSVV